MQVISRSTRYVGRFTSYLVGSTLPAYRLANGWREKASIVRLALKFVAKRAVVVLTRLAYNTVLQDDAPVVVRGITYFVGIDAAEIPVFGEIYDDRDYDRVPDFIARPGWTVLDVGANAGIFAVQQAYRGASVYAFEPNPASFRRLTKTVAANRLDDRVTIFNTALGADIGRGVLVVPLTGTSNGTVLFDTNPPETGTLTVPVDTLDHVIAALQLPCVDLLKVDTEGAELEVLRGATETLSKMTRIVLEHHSWDKLAGARKLLGEYGFSEVLHVDTDTRAGIGILYAQRSPETTL